MTTGQEALEAHKQAEHVAPQGGAVTVSSTGALAVFLSYAYIITLA